MSNGSVVKPKVEEAREKFGEVKKETAAALKAEWEKTVKALEVATKPKEELLRYIESREEETVEREEKASHDFRAITEHAREKLERSEETVSKEIAAETEETRSLTDKLAGMKRKQPVSSEKELTEVKEKLYEVDRVLARLDLLLNKKLGDLSLQAHRELHDLLDGIEAENSEFVLDVREQFARLRKGLLEDAVTAPDDRARTAVVLRYNDDAAKLKASFEARHEELRRKHEDALEALVGELTKSEMTLLKNYEHERDKVLALIEIKEGILVAAPFDVKGVGRVSAKREGSVITVKIPSVVAEQVDEARMSVSADGRLSVDLVSSYNGWTGMAPTGKVTTVLDPNQVYEGRFSEDGRLLNVIKMEEGKEVIVMDRTIRSYMEQAMAYLQSVYEKASAVAGAMEAQGRLLTDDEMAARAAREAVPARPAVEAAMPAPVVMAMPEAALAYRVERPAIPRLSEEQTPEAAVANGEAVSAALAALKVEGEMEDRRSFTAGGKKIHFTREAYERIEFLRAISAEGVGGESVREIPAYLFGKEVSPGAYVITKVHVPPFTFIDDTVKPMTHLAQVELEPGEVFLGTFHTHPGNDESWGVLSTKDIRIGGIAEHASFMIRGEDGRFYERYLDGTTGDIDQWCFDMIAPKFGTWQIYEHNREKLLEVSRQYPKEGIAQAEALRQPDSKYYSLLKYEEAGAATVA